MPRYINENEIYALFDRRGQASLHVGDIDVLPRADVEPIVRAHWIYKPMDTDVDVWLYHCSACANLSARPRAYCAECGAKMDEKVECYDEKVDCVFNGNHAMCVLARGMW